MHRKPKDGLVYLTQEDENLEEFSELPEGRDALNACATEMWMV